MKFKQLMRVWLPLAVLAVGLVGVGLLFTQQVIRQSANDPQIQLARDTVLALAERAEPWTLMPATIDPARSLSPFIQTYDSTGRLTYGSALIDGSPPRVPFSALERARAAGEYRFTWEAGPGVRIAAVVVAQPSPRTGFVLAGRSLAEADARLRSLLILASLALVVILVGSLVAVGAGAWWLGGPD